MDSLFLDTSFIIALEDADDQNNQIAVAYWKAFKRNPKMSLHLTPKDVPHTTRIILRVQADRHSMILALIFKKRPLLFEPNGYKE